MNQVKKRKQAVAVIFGGCSSEYEISLQSASSVLSHMNHEKYQVIPIGITRDGRWLRYDGAVEKLMDDTWYQDGACRPVFLSPDRSHGNLVELTEKGLTYAHIDAAFPVLHGKNGEDGTIQGLIELAGVRLIGCGTLASALCMDKDRAHLLVKEAGIKAPTAVSLSGSIPDMATLQELLQELTYPLFVKPVRAGSSYGISKIYEQEELKGAVDKALQYDNALIIEENIDGFEVGCAVMDDGFGGLLVGRVDEIQLTCGFFDYRKKYTEVDSKIHMPARIDRETEARIQETAKIIYKTLGCSGFARIDMFLTPTGEIVFNEVNTIPGFTSHSRFPKMMAGVGISFSKILEILIDGTAQGEPS
ncbi:MAG: D-alanine--D-serine ligase VanG [Firmicutes bacterium]|nr:D-alanine--D-serine ligase VanG [Bacillota bacterium]